MSMKDFLSEIIKRLKDAEKYTAEGITSGINIHTFDDYQRILGNLEGIKQSLQVIEDLLSEDDDKDL